MAIPGAGLGFVRFEYSGDSVVVASRVEFMAFPVPSLGISGLAEIWGVLFEYSGGAKGMEIPGLGSYSSLFTSWAAGVAEASSWRSPSLASGSPASPRYGADHGRRRHLGHGDPWTRHGDCPVRVQRRLHGGRRLH